MKKVSILIAILFAFAANTFAQTDVQSDIQAAPASEKMNHRGGNGKHAGAMDMKKQLNLTTEQEASMKTMRKAYGEKMKAIHSDAALTKDQKKAKFAELKNSRDGEMKSLLNADQYAKFTEMQKQRQDNMKAHKGERKGKKQGGGDAPAPKSN